MSFVFILGMSWSVMFFFIQCVAHPAGYSGRSVGRLRGGEGTAEGRSEAASRGKGPEAMVFKPAGDLGLAQ